MISLLPWYTLAALLSIGVWAVSGSHDEGGSASLLVDVNRERDLHGRVFDPQGTPLAGATLNLVKLKWRGHSLDLNRADFEASRAAHVTNALGEFRIPLGTGRQYDLEVSYEGFAERKVIGLYAGSRVDVHLQRTSSFSGHVLTDVEGKPIAGALVQGWSTDGRREKLFTGRTDDDGAFHFEGVPPRRLRVEVLPLSLATPPTYTTELLPGKAMHRDFRCGPGYRLHGKVTDARTGLAIAGALVGQGPSFIKSVRTNLSGEYEIQGFAKDGHNEPFVQAMGYGRHALRAPSNPEVMGLNFELEPSRRITGRVVGPAGEAVLDVEVAAIGASFPRDPDILNWYPGEVQADGSFVINGLQWGNYYGVFVRSADYANVVYDMPQRIKTVESFELDPIRLAPAATLRGVVRNSTGEPLAGVWLRFGDHNRNPERFLYTGVHMNDHGQQTVNENYTSCDARTDSLGRFTFTNLRSGPGLIDVLAEGSYRGVGQYVANIIHVQRVNLKAGQHLDGVEIVVTESRLRAK